jgi:high-affinity nickel-transport protein
VGRLYDHFGVLGYCIIGIFALSWIVSIAIYKVRRFEEIEVEMKA